MTPSVNSGRCTTCEQLLEEKSTVSGELLRVMQRKGGRYARFSGRHSSIDAGLDRASKPRKRDQGKVDPTSARALLKHFRPLKLVKRFGHSVTLMRRGGSV